MPKFIVTVNEQSHVAYFVEAQDEKEAKKKFIGMASLTNTWLAATPKS